MKRVTVFLFAALITAMVFPLSTYANPNMTHSAGDVSLPRSSPKIDGVIGGTEGWSEKKYIYKDNLATFGNTHEITMSCNAYFAWDENGMYYAADITDPTFVASTGPDTTDNVENDFNIHKSMNIYGYNGDIFTFTADPLSLFIDDGFTGNTDYNTWYSVGIFRDGTCKMYRGHYNGGDITSRVKVAGAITASGWRFEAFLPWELFVEDVDAASDGELSVTKDTLAARGAYFRCEIIYLDRYLDDEAEKVSTWQRYATCAYKLPDGTYGYLSSGVCLKSYGLYLTLLGQDETPPVSDTSGIANADSTVNSSQTKASPATGDTSMFIVPPLSLAVVLSLLLLPRKKRTDR